MSAGTETHDSSIGDAFQWGETLRGDLPDVPGFSGRQEGPTLRKFLLGEADLCRFKPRRGSWFDGHDRRDGLDNGRGRRWFRQMDGEAGFAAASEVILHSITAQRDAGKLVSALA